MGWLLPRHPLSTTKLQNHTRPLTATTATRVATTRTWLLPFRQMRRQQVLLWSIAWRTGSLRGEMQSNWREVCNVWTNAPSYCACYGPCDCSQGDSQTNCQRSEKVNAAMHVLANTTVNVIWQPNT